MRSSRRGWDNGLAEWIDGDTAYLSVAFTWRLSDAYQRAVWLRQAGYRVRAGGPGTFTRKGFLAEVAEVGGDAPDAIGHHHPDATMASRGCPVGCWFCIVPKMEGKSFTLFPEFPVRPILCDNNLSGLPAEYQQHIVDRYLSAGMRIRDANSGFEPRTFDDEVFARWRPILAGPWRFAYDDQAERQYVERVMRMLRGEPARRKQVYVLIGNEPFAACMDRIHEVIGWGGEPYVQPYIKLNALEKRPNVRFDWTPLALARVQRWANRRLYKYVAFRDYRPSKKTSDHASASWLPGVIGDAETRRQPATQGFWD